MRCTRSPRVLVVVAVLALLLGLHAGPVGTLAADNSAPVLRPATQSLAEFSFTVTVQVIESVITGDGTQVGPATFALRAEGDGRVATGRATMTLHEVTHVVQFRESRVSYGADGRPTVSLRGQDKLAGQVGNDKSVTTTVFVQQSIESKNSLDITLVREVAASSASPGYRDTYLFSASGTLRFID